CEIGTADSIDALVSFVTLSGVRCLQTSLEAHAQAGRRMRLLTTTYTGATEADAVDAIAVLPGVEVRISFDARRTRLHAKAWLFGTSAGALGVTGARGSSSRSIPILSNLRSSNASKRSGRCTGEGATS